MSQDGLDKDTAQILALIAQLKLPPLAQTTPQKARVSFKKLSGRGKKTPVYDVLDRDLPTRDGCVASRIYRPSDERNLPVVMFYHGGGWVLCDLDSHDEMARQMALQAQCIVVSVAYRLAPEHRFPAAIHDSYDALCWVANNLTLLGTSNTRLAVAGDSAGGNVAAVMCLMSRDLNGPEVTHQSLWYPATQMSAMATPSYQDFDSGYNLSRADMLWFKSCYLTQQSDAYLSYVSPLLCDDLTGLPPAYIMSAGYDVLKDDAVNYSRALAEAGNTVSYENFSTLVHGFIGMAAVVPAAQKAYRQSLAALKAALNR